MKKITAFLAVGAAVFALSGCGSGYDNGYDDGYNDGFYDGTRVPVDNMTTLFIRDINGFSAGGVHYTCVDPEGYVTDDYVTAPNGEFTFYPGERCTFDLYGFGGTPDDPLFIEDDTGFGKGDIPYACDGGDGGLTYPDGGFEYFPNDICTFYL
ncbi:hypothetical protein MNB_SV-10-1339 [hydrothermal vent metagenome]|uniref:Lipoprotein n=1 Tax=hydrothermal vent metagenome TaxID=652676 RepID=A0A1W1CJA7_9ZZZZ|nr:hypothetical protein [Sulfurovum sp.]